jgi:hypothetical protein
MLQQTVTTFWGTSMKLQLQILIGPRIEKGSDPTAFAGLEAAININSTYG